MKVSVENIPAETRWTIATQAMSGVAIAYSKALYDLAGPEQFNKINEQIWGQTGKGAKQIADALNMKGSDAKGVAEALSSVCMVAMGPEAKIEAVESTEEKTVMHITGCPWLNRVKEFGITEDILTAGDEAFCQTFAKSLNPNVTMLHTKRMHKGDPYCEWIFEIKK